MLTIKNLSLYMTKDLKALLNDFSFSLNPGQKVALIGEEGNGKSTLLKAIYDVSLIKDYIDIQGTIDKSSEIIGYLPQSVSEKYLGFSTMKYLEKHIDPSNFDYSKFYLLLSELKFSHELINDEIELKMLSGGEKIKFQLLVELMKSPTLLLLDEPSNDLDLESVIWLENFIKNSKMPIMFVSHDEVLLENCANVIIHIEQLRKRKLPRHNIASLSYSEYIKNREHLIEKQAQLAAKEQKEFNAKLERYRKIFERVQHEQNKVSRRDVSVGKNLKDKMHTVKAMGKRFEREKENLTQMPDVEDSIFVTFSKNKKLAQGKEVLILKLKDLKINDNVLSKDIELKIIGPKKICIIGKNGCGKTTLIKEIINELKSSKVNVGYMPQDYRDLIGINMNAIEFLANEGNKEEHTKISTYLGSLNFTREEMYRPIKKLSGGQKAKLYFAKMMLNDAEILVLDEPTRNLSPLSGPEIRSALKEFGGAIIAVSHDRKFIEEVFDEIYRLDSDGLNKTEL
ncbi:MAG: ATP-binding cassette domain-containing protein [Tissierellia bacterium]|nr:ATP-binding cassette domain-containing protein [Tissierellia bacterium]